MYDEKMRVKLHEAVDGNFDALVNDIRDSVAIPSVLDVSKCTDEHPFGETLTKALEHFLGRAEAMGFRTRNVLNMAGHAEAGAGDEIVGVLAHLDVMPAGDRAKWTKEPFGGEIADGKLYGRGTLDDKGPAFSALYAAKSLLDAGIEPKCRIRVIVGLDEESGSRCVERYLKEEEAPSCSFSPDAAFPLINAEKGIIHVHFRTNRRIGCERLISVEGGERFNAVPDSARAVIDGVLSAEERAAATSLGGVAVSEEDGRTVISASGRSAHAMCPEQGDNAAARLCAALISAGLLNGEPVAEFAAKFMSETNGASAGVAMSDEVSGALTCNLGMIRFGADSSVSLDIRYPVTADGAAILEKLKAAAAAMGAEIDVAMHSAPLFVPADTPLIKKLLEAWKTVTGEDAEPQSIGGGTYCRKLKNSVSFGPIFPGDPDLDHQPDEHVTLDNLRRMTHLYAEALALLCN